MAKRLVRDDIDKFLDHDVDLGSRTILLTDDIGEFSVGNAIKALHVLDRSSGDITIKLCTDGGEWYSGMALYDVIAACQNKVIVLGMGKVMSMGSIILQAADERVLLPNTTVLVHYGFDGFLGHVKDLERRAKESARASKVMEDIFLDRIHAKHPKFTREQFKRKFAFDVYMSAHEAIDLGLADRIAAPKD